MGILAPDSVPIELGVWPEAIVPNGRMRWGAIRGPRPDPVPRMRRAPVNTPSPEPLPLRHKGHDPMTTTDDAAPIPSLPPLTMPLEQAMRTQRALRRLRPDPVDDALVLRLIELALKAPTSRNAQHWEFMLVKDRTVKARLAHLYRMAWGLYGRLGRRLTATDAKMQRQLNAVQWQVEHVEEIPVLVVACLRGVRPVWTPWW